jgi:hypothetical protein
VGTANRGLVIQTCSGPTSRAELARHARANRTTTSGIVQHLIDIDVLAETELGQSKRSGEKPARPLWFSPSARPDLRRSTHARCGASMPGHPRQNDHRREPSRVAWRGRTSHPDHQSDQQSALTAAARKPPGVEVAVGVMVDTDQSSIVAMNLAPSLDGYPR